MLIERLDKFREQSESLKKEQHSLSCDIERVIIQRISFLSKEAGEGILDMIDRGGGIGLPFTILILKDDDSFLYVNGIDVHIKPFSNNELYLSIATEGIAENGGKYPFSKHIPFKELAFTEQVKIYKDLLKMGFFDDLHIDIFPYA